MAYPHVIPNDDVAPGEFVRIRVTNTKKLTERIGGYGVQAMLPTEQNFHVRRYGAKGANRELLGRPPAVHLRPAVRPSADVKVPIRRIGRHQARSRSPPGQHQLVQNSMDFSGRPTHAKWRCPCREKFAPKSNATELQQFGKALVAPPRA